MGRTIQMMALDQGHEIVVVIDSQADWQLKADQLKDAGVAIEFTTPETVVQNLMRCFDAGVPVVSGTTGWEAQREEVRKACITRGGALFTASNFSVGVNIFFRLNRYLGEMMEAFAQYDVSIEEIHHIHKLDAPSGTAKTLAVDLTERLQRKQAWRLGAPEQAAEIGITARREGEVNGIHQVTYTSVEDEILLKHTAKSRKGFAAGAIMAAGWLQGRSGFFTMDDLFDEILKHS